MRWVKPDKSSVTEGTGAAAAAVSVGCVAMVAVGGVTEFAAGNRATILRTAEGNKQYSVRLSDLLEDGDVSANAEMRPGDVLIIPQSWF